MTYLRNPRIPSQWESDGDWSGKFKADDGTLHDTAKEADQHDAKRQEVKPSDVAGLRGHCDDF